jgi:glycosyltransferase involved in cell wall biosynthesis
MTHANVVAMLATVLSGVTTNLVVREANSILTGLAQEGAPVERVIVRLARTLYPKASAVIANSRGSAEELEVLLGDAVDSVHVVPNPIAVSDLEEKARQAPDHPWFVEADVPVVIAIGRLSKVKDFETLISAIAIIRSRRPIRLMILGEGEERDALMGVASDLGVFGDVALPGFVDNPYPYLKNASVFVLSSRKEGFPNVLLEAAALGVPIVSTDCPNGPSELLGADSKWLVPVGDSVRLAAAIEARLADRSPPDVDVSPFAEDRVIDRYLDLLRLS